MLRVLIVAGVAVAVSGAPTEVPKRAPSLKAGVTLTGVKDTLLTRFMTHVPKANSDVLKQALQTLVARKTGAEQANKRKLMDKAQEAALKKLADNKAKALSGAKAKIASKLSPAGAALKKIDAKQRARNLQAGSGEAGSGSGESGSGSGEDVVATPAPTAEPTPTPAPVETPPPEPEVSYTYDVYSTNDLWAILAYECTSESASYVTNRIETEVGFDAETSLTISTCICSPLFESAAANAVVGGDGMTAELSDGMCTSECLPMMELVYAGTFGRRRALAEIEAPVPAADQSTDVLGRQLQASPSPMPMMSPEASPSPMEDSMIDPMQLFYCACEVPTLFALYASYEPDADDVGAFLTSACASTSCATVIEELGVDCGDYFVPEPSPAEEAEPTYDYSVTIAMTMSGTVDDYTPEVVDEMTATIAAEMGYDEDQVLITITSGSVIVTITFLVEDETVADALVADLEALDESEVSAVFSDITLADGSTPDVESIDEVTVEELSNDSKSTTDNMGAMIGGAVGGAFGGIVFLCCAIKMMCGKKKNKVGVDE